MIVTESFIEILAAADTSDEEDVALRAAIVAALRKSGADFDVVVRRGGRRFNSSDLRHHPRAIRRPAALACGVRGRVRRVDAGGVPLGDLCRRVR